MIESMPSDIFRVGQVLNNTYEIEAVLGRGGTGEVYRARNLIADRVVAIKALNARFSGKSDYVELMKREDQMRKILHDAVVRYTECSRTDEGHVFLVMDYIAGPSLNDLMLSRRLDARELMIVAHRVAQGLVVTHAHGIVHRDLSPDNVILRDGSPEAATIIDFGIAKDTTAGARTIVGNEFAGKYEYAAPEQLESRTEPRTDLYALGATLLAAYRGELPFQGASPGEMVRRKMQPLDTQGVPEPLKGLVEWLAAPKIEDRPRNAEEVVERLNGILKPTEHRAPDRATGRRRTPRRRGLRAAFLVVLAVALATGAWIWLRPTPLPVADPYRLVARFEPGAVSLLTTHAPDEAAAQVLRTAFIEATGEAPADGETVLAAGLPAQDWPAATAALIGTAAALDRWELTVNGLTARLTGLASDVATRDAVDARLVETGGSLAVEWDILAGPETLSADTLRAELRGLANCGPLALSAAPEAYGLFDTITVVGDVAGPADAETIRRALTPRIGERTLRVETTTLNDELCTIRGVLPPVAANDLSIWLGDGATGEANLTGVYRTGQNPVAEVHLPAGITEGSLWVMVVDNTGKVFHVLPNINRTGHAVGDLGVVEGGVRRVRVLHAIEELNADRSLLAMEVTDDFGKSELIAILSRESLFDMRRPRDESVASTAAALSETLAGREDIVLAVASRVIDARR